jgi:DnaJ family protein B protein 12
LQLFPLPGVEALLSQGNNTATKSSNNNNSQSSSAAAAASSSSQPSVQQQQTGECGRPYTDDQVAIVQKVLTAKQGGRGAHYRVLNIAASATEAQIKSAYRKLSLKVHPDKNAAPQASEAFKAVGLAYATLSDSQKRHIYDRYGEGEFE